MTARETKLISAGVVLGITVASVVFILWKRSPEIELPPQDHASHGSPTAPVIEQPVTAAVQLTADEQRQVGLETAEVRRRTITEEIEAVGRVEEAETAIRTISARIGGRIDRLLVNFTGQPVRTGQPIAEIYSPEIVTAAEEYRLALENRKHLAASRQAAALTQADQLIEASRRRLELWGLNPEQINGLVANPETPIHITIASSASGIIRTRNVTEGQYVNAGDALFDVIELSTVWVEADVFQSDIARIRPGIRAQITTDALPGMTLRGTVSFIKPQSDPESRTTPVRVEADNPGMRLRPGMFVKATFGLTVGANVLTVPRSAVIDTGEEKIVYVVLPAGIFQRRTIQTGTPAKDYYLVVSGLSEGEKVVSNGIFLIDSQTRLSGGMTGLFGGSTSFSEAAADSAAANKIGFRIEPDPPLGGRQNTAHATLVDSSGKAISDAQVRVTAIMPAMPSMGMPEMRNTAVLQWSGTDYVGTITIGMAGSWNVVIEARRGDQVLATHRTRFEAR